MNNPLPQRRRGRPRLWPRVVEDAGVAVRIYRRKTPSGNWGYLVANRASGKRRLDSYATEDEAENAAKRVACQIASGNAIVAELTRKEVGEYRVARTRLDPLGLSLVSAVEALADAYELTGSLDAVREAARLRAARCVPVEKKTVAEVVEALLATRADKSEGYRHDLEVRLGRFAGCFEVSVSSVTTPMIQSWLDSLGLSARSRRNYRAAVCALFAFAERRGFVAKGQNPAPDTEPIKSRIGRIHILKPEQFERLLSAGSPETLPVYVLCGFSGLRTAEALRLRWEQIDFAKSHVVVGPDEAKTASRRLAPLPGNAVEWLAPYAGRVGPVWPQSGQDFFKRRVIEARKADVKWHNNVLRHSAISYRVAQTNDVKLVSIQSGNSPAMVFGNYRELVTDGAEKAWFGIRPPTAAANVIPMAADN